MEEKRNIARYQRIIDKRHTFTIPKIKKKTLQMVNKCKKRLVSVLFKVIQTETLNHFLKLNLLG